MGKIRDFLNVLIGNDDQEGYNKDPQIAAELAELERVEKESASAATIRNGKYSAETPVARKGKQVTSGTMRGKGRPSKKEMEDQGKGEIA